MVATDNQSEAAEAAGYAIRSASNQGYRLMNRDDIKHVVGMLRYKDAMQNGIPTSSNDEPNDNHAVICF